MCIGALLKAQLPGDSTIMAQLQTLHPTLRTPAPSPRDSDDVLLALQTAHALEMRGDLAEAAHWLQRAANEAEKQGNDMRVLALAHAAADLTSASRQSSMTKTSSRIEALREPHDSEPTLYWRATPPPLPSHTSSAPARASSTPAPAKPISILRERSTVKEPPVIGHPKARMEAVRVAIKKSSSGRSFLVERLDGQQPPPAGTVEALLVLTDDTDDRATR
jgi:hypothetical protein